jgi:hypothetical protein
MAVIGYVSLGLLVGILTGLTSSSIATTILASIFTLAGGSIAHLLQKSDAQRKLIGSVLTGFALSCLLGVFVGIYAKVNRILDVAPSASIEHVDYLKAVDLKEVNEINVRYKGGDLKADEAYERLWNAIHR